MRRRSWVVAALAAGALSALVTCSISDENGNPAEPGQYTPTGPTTPTNPSVDPALTVTGAQDIMPGDTLWLSVSLFDQNNHNEGIASARVTVRTVADSAAPVYDTVVTNAEGHASVWYRSTVLGSVTMTFTYGGASRTVTFDVTAEPTPPQRLIVVRADNASLAADGKSTTQIHVTVINEAHWPLVGEAVAFITTSGVIAGNDPPSDSLSGVSITNEDGVATATLTSTAINDTAIITAFLLSDLSMSAETRVAFLGVHLEVDVDTNNLSQGQEAIVTATLLNGSNEPVVQTPITFRMTRGAASPFQVLYSDTVTGFDGTAMMQVRASAASGSDSVIVSAAGARAVLSMNVTSLRLTVWVNQDHLVSSDTATTVLNVRFTNMAGSPLGGKVVRIVRHYPSATGVPLVDSMTVNTNANGEDTVRVKGLSYDGTVRFAVTAFDSPGNFATAEASVTVTTTRYLTIEALPGIIQADGSSGSQITVQVKNQQGNPIQGDTVLYSTTAGLIQGTGVTDSRGRAVDTLYSDRRNVTARVTAVLKRDITKFDSVNVVFAGVSIAANASPRSIKGDGRDTSFITVLLTDATGNPIPGEAITFRPKHQDSTFVVARDEVTDNRGQASCKVVGIGAGSDTVVIQAAGAEGRPVIYYSSNKLTIDTLGGQPLVADGKSQCGIVVTYTTGSDAPIANAPVSISVTLGSVDTAYFARTSLTDAAGRVTFNMQSPSFANTATIAAEATAPTEITTATRQFYFKATKVTKITLTVTPKTISTNGDKATVTAVAVDSMGNRVADALIAFNIARGPGGEERLEPPTAVTGYDGTATTTLISGTMPSTFEEVMLVAGDFEGVKSDTAFLTIAGPPYAIMVGSNIFKGENLSDGTFGLPCAALVSDVNGNPVADGTEVTFSCKITGYATWKYGATFHYQVDEFGQSWLHVTYRTDTLIVPFEDLNDNHRLDVGEDRNGDGVASRGEDYNGDGVYNPGPGFDDINHNGVRDKCTDASGWGCPEPIRIVEAYRLQRVVDSTVARLDSLFRIDSALVGTVWEYDTVFTGLDTVWDWDTTRQWYWGYDTAFADYNHNGFADTIEPLLTSPLTWDQYVAQRNAYDPVVGFDRDFDGNGRADPNTTALIRRTVQTKDGKATNKVVYGQSDAGKIQVTISAEAQGVITIVPNIVILPAIL